MITLMLRLLRLLPFLVGGHCQLALENLALRQQLDVYKRTMARPPLRRTDRLFWVVLARVWTGWRRPLVIVTPNTVLRWQRRRFPEYWTKLSARPPGGRPPVSAEIKALVSRMVAANPLWGAPRILAERTVSRLMPKHRPRPSQTWRTFLANHVRDLVSLDFFTVPTAGLRVLFVLVVVAHHRRRAYLLRDRDAVYGDTFLQRVKGMGIGEVLTAPRSPWQNPFAERLIGSIRRECLDHVVVFGEWHLRRILSAYFAYYHRARTHLSLDKDAPDGRPIEPPALGAIIPIPEVGGLHHRYVRRAS